jgi:Putative peptidoglycan binding domain
MKKFTNLLIVASLALAGAVMAQQPSPEESPSKKAPDKKPPAELKPPAPRGPKAEAPAVKEPAAKEPGANEAPVPPKPDKKGPQTHKPAPAAVTEPKADQPAASATPPAKKELPPKHNKDTKAPDASAKTSPSATAATAKTTPAAKTTATPAVAATTPPAAATTPAATTPAAAASASAAPSVAQTSPTNPVNPTAAAKKPDVQKVQQIQQQHVSFHAQPRPDKVPAVTFTANYRIQGSDRWQGPKYEVYRSYHPERHDQGWYRSHYQRVELISGGYYYYNSGYWYPAWGYNPSNEYYAYDAPIYAGKHAEPPDKVIADVQAVLQEMGYYKGEVDGLLGPLTREALTGYQTDQGMVATAVIDEPTLDSLGMG